MQFKVMVPLILGFIFAANALADHARVSSHAPESTLLGSCKLLAETHGLELLMQGKLSPLWAQENIGADIVGDIARTLGPIFPTPIGVMDSNFDADLVRGNMTPQLARRLKENPSRFRGDYVAPTTEIDANRATSHGTLVTNIISATNTLPPTGVGHFGQLKVLHAASVTGDWSQGVEEALKEGVRLINFSIGYSELPDEERARFGPAAKKAASAMESLKSKNIIMVRSAGNEHPLPLDELTRGILGITVGSVAPTGLVSNFSQEGSGVDVLAPSNKEILSLGRSGKVESFGGTSGAAPLVTGALAFPMALLTGLRLEEARALIRMAATPSFNTQEKPQNNGTGIVNQLRMAEVALRLRDGWPSNRHQLSDPKTYDFNGESTLYYDLAMEKLQAEGCSTKKEGFKLLRRAFFLNPGNTYARAALIRFYRAQGLNANARFFETLGMTPEELLADLAKRADSESESLREAGRNLGTRAVPLLEKYLSTSHGRVALQEIGRLGLTDRLRDLFRKGSQRTRQDISEVVDHLPKNERLEFLQVMIGDKDEYVQVGALYASVSLGSYALPIFDRATRLNGGSMRERALAASRVLGSRRIGFLLDVWEKYPASVLAKLPEILEVNDSDSSRLLETILKSPDVDTRRRVLIAFHDHLRRPEKRSPVFLNLLEHTLADPSPDVAHWAGLALQLYGERGFSKLRGLALHPEAPRRRVAFGVFRLAPEAKDPSSPNLADNYQALIRKGLHDSDAKVVAASIHAARAWKLDPSNYLHLRKSANLGIRSALLEAAVENKSLPILEALSSDPNAEIRGPAIANLPISQAIKGLKQALSDPRDDMRISVYSSARLYLPPQVSVQFFKIGIQDESKEVRTRVCRMFAWSEQTSKVALPVVAESRDPYVRSTFISAVLDRGAAEAHLRAEFSNLPASVRGEIVSLFPLDRSYNPWAIRMGLRDGEREVRRMAVARALAAVNTGQGYRFTADDQILIQSLVDNSSDATRILVGP